MADEAVASMTSEPRGRLRVSSPVGLAHAFLPTVITRFLELHPQVQLEMVLVNRRVDLINEGIDVALRVRDVGDEDPALVTRRLNRAQMQLVASPDFVRQHPVTHPGELAGLPVLGAAEADRLVHLRLLNADGQSEDLALEARLSIDDFVVRKAAALAGLGFTALPLLHCETELASGELVHLLPDWSMPSGFLQAVYPHRRGVLPAVRAWIDHLVTSFEECGERYV